MGVAINTQTAKELLAGKIAQVQSAEEKTLYLKLDDSAKSEYGPRFVFETAENFAVQNADAAKSSQKKKGGKKKENKEEIPQDSGQICL